MNSGEVNCIRGLPENLIFVQDDPEPQRVTKIVVDQGYAGKATFFSQGMLAGANLVEYIEATYAEQIISIEEFSFTGAEHPLQP